MSMPFVSIIIPAYNAKRTIGRLLSSLAALDYPRDRYEVVVVDNGSTDGTRAVIEAAGVRCLKERSVQSSYAARNRGVEAARGELVAFVDADCEVPPDWLSRTTPAFADPSIGCVACEIVGPPPVTPLEAYLAQHHVLSPRQTLRHPFLPYAQTACVIYRRSVFERIGRFEPWVSSADADFDWRMQQKTALRIHFEASVTVWHYHRSTAWKYFKQRFKWAYGSVVLYRKYRGDMPYDWRKSRWECKQLLVRLVKWPAVWWRSQRDAVALPAWKREGYEIITELATRLGRAYGSLRHGVWYV